MKLYFYGIIHTPGRWVGLVVHSSTLLLKPAARMLDIVVAQSDISEQRLYGRGQRRKHA